MVVATGPATAFGDIAARLAMRPPETEFERGTRQFALLIMRTVFFLVLFVLLVAALLHHARFSSRCSSRSPSPWGSRPSSCR